LDHKSVDRPPVDRDIQRRWRLRV